MHMYLYIYIYVAYIHNYVVYVHICIYMRACLVSQLVSLRVQLYRWLGDLARQRFFEMLHQPTIRVKTATLLLEDICAAAERLRGEARGCLPESTMREEAQINRALGEVCNYRVAKTHRMPYLYRSFSAKDPYNQWLFREK